MPMWDFKCPTCHKVVERLLPRYRETTLCDCGAIARVMVSKATPKVFKPLTLEHIDVEHGQPLTFTSERDLRAYCRKHHVSSGALL